MTGNVVFLGFALARVPGFSLVRSLAALAAFLAGAVIGGRLAIRLEGLRPRWVAAVAGVEASPPFAAAPTGPGYYGGPALPLPPLYPPVPPPAPGLGPPHPAVGRP